MRRVLQRGILPILMLGLGVAALVWGAKHHVLEVFEEQEIEISIAPPEMMLPEPVYPGPGMGMEGEFPGPGGFDDPFGPPGGMPMFAGPPPELQTIKQTIWVAKEEWEPRLVFEVTVGGLVLLETGELQRTYRGAPPSLCPT